MSVFKKLKGSFQNAQQDLVDGLRALTTLDGPSKAKQLHHIKSKDISLDAGADLLHEYQDTWSKIQYETKMCSKKAEEIDMVLAPMFTIWDKRTEFVTALEEEVKAIPSILVTLKDIHTLLDAIRLDFSVAESSLSLLENLCEELDVKKAIEKETKQLNNYRNLKEKEVERIKVNLAQNHARKMQDIESSKTLKMKERAEAFTSAFEEDLDYYKTHGRPDCKLVTEFPKVSSLSEIDLVDDRKDLDTFLGPQTEGGEQDAVEEEQYFEDDYTADFSVKEDLEMPEVEEDLKAQLYLSYNDDSYADEDPSIDDVEAEGAENSSPSKEDNDIIDDNQTKQDSSLKASGESEENIGVDNLEVEGDKNVGNES